MHFFLNHLELYYEIKSKFGGENVDIVFREIVIDVNYISSKEFKS